MPLERTELARRTARLDEIMRSCALCPRRCQVDRTAGEKGYCGMGSRAVVSSMGAHFGEEPELVGNGGSGTIFFAGCNLLCLFCQNYDISHGREGDEVSDRELADMMLRLQDRGCENINFVTPTHFSPPIVRALDLAWELGLRLPIVWNCGGYESVEVLKLLEGIVDIYMPDAKFAFPQPAEKYCSAPDYPEVMKQALKEMHRQAGVLRTDSEGKAVRGLLVRHLVMPGGLEDAALIMDFIAAELSPDTYVNIMAQYRPCHRAKEFPEINRGPNREEFLAALDLARKAGLNRGF